MVLEKLCGFFASSRLCVRLFVLCQYRFILFLEIAVDRCVAQNHNLIRAQAERFETAALTVTELNFKGVALGENFNHGADLPAP